MSQIKTRGRNLWGNTADSTSGTDWTFGNTTTTTITGAWYRRLQGPTYAIAKATLILLQTRNHKPGKYANIGGVQFKRTTRVGKRHYYQAMA